MAIEAETTHNSQIFLITSKFVVLSRDDAIDLPKGTEIRKGMQKVICERARIAHYQAWTTTRDLNKRRNPYRNAKYFQLDECGNVCDEFTGGKLLMRCRQLGRKVKIFNENLRPFWRFLY